MFMPGTVDQGFELDATADIERANTLGRIELAGDRQQIDAERIDLGRNLAD